VVLATPPSGKSMFFGNFLKFFKKEAHATYYVAKSTTNFNGVFMTTAKLLLKPLPGSYLRGPDRSFSTLISKIQNIFEFGKDLH
jgi:hypothetical protein